MNFNKILVTGDITRLNESGIPSQDININWLFDLIHPAIDHLTNLEVEKFASTAASSFTTQMYGINKMEPTIENWAKLFYKDPTALELGLCQTYFNNSLVISFEISELVRKSLDILNIPYIDLTIHPIRYLDDLLFGVRSNIVGLEKSLSVFSCSDEYIIEGTALARSRLSKFPRLTTLLEGAENVGLFASQTLDDKVLINNGKFMEHEMFFNQMKEMTEMHELILIKPHPYAKDNMINIALSRLFPNVKYTEDNFYHLLSQEEINTVYSITSSTSIEASYFGKKGRHFSDYPYYFTNDKCSSGAFMTIFPVIYKICFWAEVLDHLAVESLKTKQQFTVDSLVPNRMRKSLNVYWAADILI